jgi:hypothetical protein
MKETHAQLQHTAIKNRDLIVAVAHVLIYKVYGKLYIGEHTA